MQHQLLGLDDAVLLLSVSESVSSLLLLAALRIPGLVLDVSILPRGSDAPLLITWLDVSGVCPLSNGELLTSVGMLCREENSYYTQSPQQSFLRCIVLFYILVNTKEHQKRINSG